MQDNTFSTNLHMTYFIVIAVASVLISTILSNFVSEPWQWFVLIIFLLAFVISQGFIISKVFFRPIDGQMKLKRFNRRLGMAILWILVIFFYKQHGTLDFLKIWAICLLLSETLLWFLFKKYQPEVLGINNNHIFYQDLWFYYRSIDDLNEISLDKITNTIQFKFYSKDPMKILIPLNDFERQDIIDFISELKVRNPSILLSLSIKKILSSNFETN